MDTRVRHILEKLRASLWFIPSLMALGAILLSELVLRLDARLPADGLYTKFLLSMSPEAFRALMTTIAGSMIAVTGVTFSITMVALSLASSQLGPRLLRSFTRDRSNQFVLGTFIATFTFTLLALRGGNVDPEGTVPAVTVTVAGILSLASIAVLIYFVHHVAHAIQADTVIAGVAAELESNIDRMYPERMGHEPPQETERARLPAEFRARAQTIHAKRSGYVQAVDEEGLMALAKEDDLILQVAYHPGDFVIEGSPMLLAWPPERVDKDVEERARRMFLLGKQRTTEQDVEFSIDQLEEVAVRALSPGINDPFTAMRCVDRLGSALCRLCLRRFPSPYRHDEDGHLRVLVKRPDFPGLVNAAFNQIREYGRTSVPVTIRLLEVLEIVAGCARGRPDLVAPLREQVEKVYEGAQAAGHTSRDMQDVERRYHDAIAALDAAPEEEGAAPRMPRKREAADE